MNEPNHRTEWDIFVKFKNGGAFRTCRFTKLDEAESTFDALQPSKPGNENILEVQFYQHDITEITQFLKRRPEWGA